MSDEELNEWDEPTWESGDIDPNWDELFISNSLFLMRNLQNDMKTNNLEAMIKRLSSLNPKQLDTFLHEYHSIDDSCQGDKQDKQDKHDKHDKQDKHDKHDKQDEQDEQDEKNP